MCIRTISTWSAIICCTWTLCRPSIAERPEWLLSPEITIQQNNQGLLVLEWDASNLELNANLQTLLAIPEDPLPELEIEALQLKDRSIEQPGWKAGAPATLKEASPELSFDEPRIHLTPLGHLGQCRIASLQINPTVREFYEENAFTGVYEKGRITIQWPENSTTTAPNRDPRPFIDEVLSATILNYPARFKPFADSSSTLKSLPDWLSPASLLYLKDDEEIIRIKGSTLLEHFGAGGPLQMSGLKAISDSKPLPVAFTDTSGRFIENRALREDDSAWIWSPKPDDPYLRQRHVLVFFGNEDGLDWQAPVADPITGLIESATAEIILEEDHVIWPEGSSNEQQDNSWMWCEMSAGEVARVTFPSLPGNAQSVQLTLAMKASRAGIFDTTEAQAGLLELNGHVLKIEQTQGSGYQERDIVAHIPPRRLRGPTNELTVAIPPENGQPTLYSKNDRFYIDRMTLEIVGTFSAKDTNVPIKVCPGKIHIRDFGNHQLAALDITEPWLPQRIKTEGDALFVSGENGTEKRIVFFDLTTAETPPARQYNATPAHGRLIDPGEHVDMLVVGPRDFEEPLQPWFHALEIRGMRLFYAPLEDVNVVFGDGGLRPQPIQSFVHHSLNAWLDGGPSWLVLVGDATWDTKSRFGNGIGNILPSYRGKDDYAVESWFGAVLGDDSLPDLMVSRLPVRTVEELQTLVTKLVRQETTRQKPESWRNRVLLLTDDSFETYMEPASEYGLPPSMRHNQLFVADAPFEDNFYLPEDVRRRLKSKTSTVLTTQIIDALNEGVWLWEFFGHGAPNLLAHERAFFGGGSKFSDVLRLNESMPPFMLWAFTCETGSFDYAQEKWNISIGEDLLVRHEGGTVCLLVATGRGYPRDHKLLSLGMHEAMFAKGLATTGQALLAANLMAMAQRTIFEPLKQFAILGDPLVGPISFRDLKGKLEWSGADTLRYHWDIPANLRENPAKATIWWRDDRGQERQSIEKDAGSRVEGNLQFKDIKRGRSAGWVGIELVRDGEVLAHGAEKIPALEAVPAKPLILDGTPNLLIQSAKVAAPQNPYTGQTIYVDVQVANAGTASATQIEIGLFDGPRENGGTPCEARVGKKPFIIERLDPNESGKIRLRWDPVDNAGDHHLQAIADSNESILESDETDNTFDIPLHVRQKANLVVLEKDVSLLKLGEGYRLDFVVRNVGDRDAERIQVELKVKLKDNPKPIVQILPPQEGVTHSIQAKGSWANSNIKLPVPNIEWIQITADPESLVDEETHADNSFRIEPQ